MGVVTGKAPPQPGEPGVTPVTNGDKPRSSKGMGAAGPGKELRVLSPSWCLGRGQDRPAGSFPALDTSLCAHLRRCCFSLWDELIWSFDTRNSRGDAQNKPAKLKIAHIAAAFKLKNSPGELL